MVAKSTLRTLRSLALCLCFDFSGHGLEYICLRAAQDEEATVTSVVNTAIAVLVVAASGCQATTLHLLLHSALHFILPLLLLAIVTGGGHVKPLLLGHCNRGAGGMVWLL